MTPNQSPSQARDDDKSLPGEPRKEHSSQPATDDAELQKRYRQEYLIQLRRLSCPGCGEEPIV